MRKRGKERGKKKQYSHLLYEGIKEFWIFRKIVSKNIVFHVIVNNKKYIFAFVTKGYFLEKTAK